MKKFYNKYLIYKTYFKIDYLLVLIIKININNIITNFLKYFIIIIIKINNF